MIDGLEGLELIVKVAPPDLVLAHEDPVRPVHPDILGIESRERDRVRRDLCGNQTFR